MIFDRDLNVNYLDMPTTIKGRTVPNEDGSFTVFINSRLSHTEQGEAFYHETTHIKSGDFDHDHKDVQMIETRAHNRRKPHGR